MEEAAFGRALTDVQELVSREEIQKVLILITDKYRNTLHPGGDEGVSHDIFDLNNVSFVENLCIMCWALCKLLEDSEHLRVLRI